MGAQSWITMAVIMLLVWGGFGWLLLLAFRKEHRKDDAAIRDL